MNAMAAIHSEQMQAALAEFGERLRDPWWRLTSGKLYKIADKNGDITPFTPNEQQLYLLRNLAPRMTIPKARQLGITTLGCLFLLDHALWVPNQNCGFIAHDQDSMRKIFQTKVLFAYENLPVALRQALPTARKTLDGSIEFTNGSKVEVALSFRSGTNQRLWVSELAKMGRLYPRRAAEVRSGSFQTVPAAGGLIAVESTSEGPSGPFYEITAPAFAKEISGEPMTSLDWRVFFFPWYEEKTYRLSPEDAEAIRISPREHEYFDGLQHSMGITIDLGQRAWYIQKRRTEFGGDPVEMNREYPSSIDECWKISLEGTWYADQLSAARAEGRIRPSLPTLEHVPVNTFWDIGNSDGTAIWLHQHVHPEHRFIGFIEGWGEGYASFIRQMQAMPVLWGKHYLPHDAAHERQGTYRPYRPIDELQKLAPSWSFEIVPRVSELMHGITALKKDFGQCWFDETACASGLTHLQLYKKRFVTATQAYADEPVKFDGHSEAADALRQFAQAFDGLNPTVRAGQRPSSRRRARG